MVKKQTGRTIQVLVLEIKRNYEDKKVPLIRLQTYFKEKENENYVLLGDSYGSPRKSLVKLTKLYLDLGLIEKPRLALYEIAGVFIDTKKIGSEELGDFGLVYDVRKLIDYFMPKKNVEVVENGEE